MTFTLGTGLSLVDKCALRNAQTEFARQVEALPLGSPERLAADTAKDGIMSPVVRADAWLWRITQLSTGLRCRRGSAQAPDR